jgi:hypothetical protein
MALFMLVAMGLAAVALISARPWQPLVERTLA